MFSQMACTAPNKENVLMWAGLEEDYKTSSMLYFIINSKSL